jgi:hypothetical protein
MIQIHLEDNEMELELRGSDALIVEELSVTVARILIAMETSGGNPVRENFTALVLKLLPCTEEDS